MFDVGLLVKLEEIELFVRELEQLAPAHAFETEPAFLPHDAFAVTGNVGTFGAGVGDDAFEPVAVAHQTVPRGPRERGRLDRLRRADVVEVHADERAELLQDLPMRLAV